MRRKTLSHRLWTADDVRRLRAAAGKRPRPDIARVLRRSPAAVTFKAWQLGLSLAVRKHRKR